MYLILTLISLWTVTASINGLTQGYYILKHTNLKSTSFDEVNRGHLQMIKFLFIICTILLFSVTFFGVSIYWWARLGLFIILIILGVSSGIYKIKSDIYNKKVQWNTKVDDYYPIGFIIVSLTTLIVALFLK
ncbi:hypothetical protein [Sphingobacterium paucimobilis]|uniref:Uncharacterized protein n=1 Tax=Sphingobacterium paucimobilis HER1398 TaxID=1346330 RepID=U2HS71_9SPHI|nr:hypothetical protein [Sphingobacterium paucimobilis]ERJ58115.1 hypothetical protein M472_04990 [Sphingobacterium paucimobilis HER1398]